MRHAAAVKLRQSACALAAALALVSGCGTSEQAISTSPTESTSGFNPECADRADHPSYVVITCADGGSMAVDLTWSAWGADEATASGTLEENDCNPACVIGPKRRYPARFRFYAPQTGQFTMVDIAFVDRGPLGQRSRTAYL